MRVISNVQALRGLAAMTVVCIHLAPLFHRIGVPFPSGGVELFFVISGFIMTYTTRGSRSDFGTFATHRIARIVPIYWLFTFAIFLAALMAPAFFQNTRAEISALIKSLAFIPFSKNGSALQPLLFVGWTLNYEMAFYALFSLFLPFRRGPEMVAAILCCAVVVGIFIPDSFLIASFYTSPYLLLFAEGIWVALAIDKAQPRSGPLFAMAGFALPIVLYGTHWCPDLHSAIAVGPAATPLVYCAVRLDRSSHAIRNRIVMAIGDASYSIYLSHAFVCLAIVRAMAGSSPVTAAIGIALGLLLSATAGHLIHLYIERPLHSWTKRLLLAR